MEQKNRSKAVTLVLGGARSGKSRYAEKLVTGAVAVTYIATARACDAEMAEKIRCHQVQRPKNWRTVEEPVELGRAVLQSSCSSDYLLVDCLTIFAANLLESTQGDLAQIEKRVAELLCALDAAACPIVPVSNEVGSGVVPPYPLGRVYRDLLGELNQRVAASADDVLLMVAGLPLALKGTAQGRS
jgi:adenosylcobinamide kinase/adenosylcobinamide-phosphate guanylyltransferase